MDAATRDEVLGALRQSDLEMGRLRSLVIRALQQATPRELPLVMALYARLPEGDRQRAQEAYAKLSEETLENVQRARKSTTLGDADLLLALSSDELKLVSIGAAYFIANVAQRPAMLDPDRFIAVTGYAHTEKTRTVIPLVLSFYLHIDMEASLRSIAIFPKAHAGAVAAYIGTPSQATFERLREGIARYAYSDDEMKASRRALYDTVARNIEETYRALGKSLAVRKRVRRSLSRLGARMAVLVLLLLVIGEFFPAFFRNAFAPSRMTSVAYAEQAVEESCIRNQRDIESGLYDYIGHMPQASFEGQRKLLLRSLEEACGDRKAYVKNITEVWALAGEDISAEVRKTFTDPRVVDKISMIADESLKRLDAMAVPLPYAWKGDRLRAFEAREWFEHRLIEHVGRLFEKEEFQRALAQDLKEGIIKVEIAESEFEKEANKELYWSNVEAGVAADRYVRKALRCVRHELADLFAQSYHFAHGTITGDRIEVSEAKSYAARVVAVIAGMFALMTVLFPFFTPYVYLGRKYFGAVVKFAVKGPVLLFDVMVMSVLRDGLTLRGSTRIDTVAKLQLDFKGLGGIFSRWR